MISSPWKFCLKVKININPIRNYAYLSEQIIKHAHWADARRKVTGPDLALNHFDNFYSKVYGQKYKSIRLALLSPQKYVAVVNVFGNNEETEAILKDLGCLELGRYYEKHYKYTQRYKLRKRILKEKKEKKIAKIAASLGVDPVKIDPHSISDVSDVSDSELKGRGFTSMSEAEDAARLFETDQKEFDGPMNMASTQVNLNDFVPSTQFRSREEIITDAAYYEYYEENSEFPLEYEQEAKLDYPNVLKIYSFRRADMSEFPSPGYDKELGVTSYYLMDGASLLPILCLGIQPKDLVADYCAAPGGKALTMLQTLRPSLLYCNEMSPSRFARLKNVFKTYVPDFSSIRDILKFQKSDASKLIIPDGFDKILIDAPCTNDKHSLQVDENNLFKSNRINERTKIPEKQQAILTAGLKSLKKEGTLVYSTCTLSPIQNDGVVHMSLKQLWEEDGLSFRIVELKESLRPYRGLYRIDANKYGQTVIPFLPSNFGPMYICKIKRVN